MQNKDKADGIEDSPLDMLLVILLEGASKEVVMPSSESLPSYIDGAPPWTPTNRGHGITSRPLKHDLEVSPRDFKELHTDQIPNIYKRPSNRYIYHA